MSELPDEDLEGAYLLVHYLKEAISCVQIQRDMEKEAK